MKVQLEINFDKKFESLKEAAVHSVYNSNLSIKIIASRLDHSPSNLSRRLSLIKNDAEPCLSVEDLEGIIETTGDYTPIYYLVEKYLRKEQDVILKEFQKFREQIPTLKKLISLVEGAK